MPSSSLIIASILFKYLQKSWIEDDGAARFAAPKQDSQHVHKRPRVKRREGGRN